MNLIMTFKSSLFISLPHSHVLEEATLLCNMYADNRVPDADHLDPNTPVPHRNPEPELATELFGMFRNRKVIQGQYPILTINCAWIGFSIN